MEYGTTRPVSLSMEADLDREAQTVKDLVREHYATGTGVGLVDDGIELQHPAAQFQYLRSLSRIMGGDSMDHFLALHGAYHFAITLAGMLDWPVADPRVSMSSFDYIPRDSTDEQARILLLDRAAQYLELRPELAKVIDLYKGDYARMPDGSFSEEAQAICALTCEEIERNGIAKRLLPDYYVN